MKRILSLLLVSFLFPLSAAFAEIQPYDLRLEYLTAPLGIDETKPRFSWKLKSRGENGQAQSAYSIVVKKQRKGEGTEHVFDTAGKFVKPVEKGVTIPGMPAKATTHVHAGDLDNGKTVWDTGKVQSPSQFVEYGGEPLESKSAYTWTLTVYDNRGNASRSLVADFSTGILTPEGWTAKWIGLDRISLEDDTAASGKQRPSLPARTLAKIWTPKGKVLSATAYISGLGYYELSLVTSGGQKKIGDHELDPVLTDYDKRVPYVTYNLDPKMLETATEIRVLLGNGRFYAPRTNNPPTLTYGYPKLLFQMDVKYLDGSEETVVSGDGWLLNTDGPIRDNNDYDGEIFDARKTLPLEFVKKAELVAAPKGKLVAQMMPPMRVLETIPAVSVKEIKKGVWVFDFGKNIVGNCTFNIPSGLPKGTEVLIRHAETLQKDGSLYTANLRGAKCRDIYIASGKERYGSAYTPTFTYHGFRYAEITGLPDGEKLDKDTLTARSINTDLPTVGKFKTNNETVNAVFQMVWQGTRDNYLSIPVDCPQRDERQGWQGDRGGEAFGELMMFDAVTLYSKWLIDIEDSQRPDGNLSDVCPNYWSFYSSNVTWPSAFVIIPDSIYTATGDRRPIERHYEAMKRWLIGHHGKFVKEGIIDKDNYGDWCVPPEKPELIHSNDPARKTSKAVLATSYYIHDLDLLAKYAKMLGKNTEADDFVQKAAAMRKAFNDKFLNKETGKYDNGTQTSCVLPLYFNIVPDDMKEKVFATLVNNIENVTKKHIGTGLIGGQWLNRTLTDFGRPDLAYTFAANTDYPSWGYMLSKGATTVWELWNGDTANPEMNSGNHVMLVGDLIIWYYESLAGIKADPEKPGFEHIIMKPQMVAGLNFVEAEIDTVKGPVRSSWRKSGKRFKWKVEIPVGSTATIYLPDGTKYDKMGSGKHEFEAELP